MKMLANVSVERTAAGEACLQIRSSRGRRHRSPHRWAEHPDIRV